MKYRIAAGLAGAVVVIVVILVLLPSGPHAPAPPPLDGWMRNFTPTAEPLPAPRTGFADRAGRTRTLGDYRGRLVLVNFWATWCLPCLREMPGLVRLQAKLGGADFTVLALSEDREGWPVMAPFIEKHGLAGLPAFHDVGGRAALALKVLGLPTTVLFDRAGNELGRLAGPAEWDSHEAVALIRHYMGRRARADRRKPP